MEYGEKTACGRNIMRCGERKRELRRSVFSRRRQVPAEIRLHAGRRLAQAAQPLVAACSPGDTVAAYVSMGSEIPTHMLLQSLLDHDVRLLVPMLGNGMDVGWGELASMDDLAKAGDAASDDGSRPRHRPAEPMHAHALTGKALEDASVIIMPALMVDHAGVRLGRGGGWYDRALMHADPRALAVAVCWPWEIVEEPLPCEPHDRTVDAVLTPDALIRL